MSVEVTPPPATGQEALGLPISFFSGNAAKLDPAEFETVHGPGFLLHQGPLARLNRQARSQPTVVSDTRHLDRSTDLPFLAFPLRALGDSITLCLGRAHSNDVVLSEPSVSKLHALVRFDGEGLTIEDARSQNGTWVDDRPVPVSGRGAPVRLESGGVVRLGAVELTYLDAPDFQQLVKALARG